MTYDDLIFKAETHINEAKFTDSKHLRNVYTTLATQALNRAEMLRKKQETRSSKSLKVFELFSRNWLRLLKGFSKMDGD
jgi:hypothetical protein